MRKFWFYLLGLILIAAAAAAIIFAAKSSKSHDDNTSTIPATAGNQTKTACRIFTLADAKQLMGDNAKGGQNPVFGPSNDLSISTCTYTQDEGANAPVSSRKVATLLARVPKTPTGTTSNQSQFDGLKPQGVEDISGYGDKAYWDSQHGQLNILKNNTWYILSYGPISPGDRTFDQTKQMADLLVGKL